MASCHANAKKWWLTPQCHNVDKAITPWFEVPGHVSTIRGQDGGGLRKTKGMPMA